MTDLIDRLNECRQQEGISLRAQARKLGVNASYLSQVSRRREMPGTRFLSAIMRTYPDLTADVLDFINARVPRGIRHD